MGAMQRDDSFSASYVHGDSERRSEFDRRLGSYLSSHRDRWDVTAIVEPLELAGRKVEQVDLRLRRSAAGKLSVTIEFELEPAVWHDGRAEPPPAATDGSSKIPDG